MPGPCTLILLCFSTKDSKGGGTKEILARKTKFLYSNNQTANRKGIIGKLWHVY